MKKLSILTILFLSIMSAQPVYVPLEMSFQGFLTDSEGTAYTDGEYELTFRLIFENPAAPDNVIWEESHTTSVSNGVFSVILGSTTPLPQSIHPFVKLETQVGEEVLSPRQSFTSVPYALNSIRSVSAYQSVLADTAMISLNAPMADTAQFSYQSQHANHADSSMYSAHSQHATYADTAYYVDQAQSAINAQSAEIAIHATYSDTSDYALGIVGGIQVDDVQNATYADTAYYVEQAQNALTADEAISAENSTYADTAYFVQESQSSLIANEATIANNSTYADTAYYVQQAQSALTAVVSQNSTNATYADTAEFVDLSQHGQNMQVVQSDNAQITLRSSGDGSASFVTLIAKEPDGDQTELRVMNEGNTNELKVYDATNDNYLMTVGNDGKVTATSFVGDGSGLTGINSGATIGFPNSEVFNGVIPSEWTDLDLSSVIGDNKAMVLLKVDLTNWENSQSNSLIIRPKGDINEYLYSYNGSWSSATSSSLNVLGLATQSQTTIIYTNDDGIIQIKAPNVIEVAPVSINVAFFMH